MTSKRLSLDKAANRRMLKASHKDVFLGKYFKRFRKGCWLLIPLFYPFYWWEFNRFTQTGESTSSVVAGSLIPQFLMKNAANFAFVIFASGAMMT